MPFAFESCAKVGTLTGGSKDTRPPALDSAGSTRNFLTRFSEKEIKLEFDEWVKLDNPVQQILISPPLAEKPKFELRKKTVHIKLPENERLRPNTTYTIQFGTAIKDLTEGNVAKDLRLVFSTGDVIDSLALGGSVVDAFSGQPVDGAAIFVYDNLADSVPSRERPLYVGKTDKTGAYKIENMRSGLFKIMAVEDKIPDYKMNDSERRGFVAEPLFLNDSTQKRSVVMQLFEERKVAQIERAESKQFGLTKFFFDGKPTGKERPNWLDGPQLIDYEQVMDTLYAWSDFEGALKIKKTNSDTIEIKLQNRADFLKKRKLVFAEDVASGGGRRNASSEKFGNPNSARGGAQPQNQSTNQSTNLPPKTEVKKAAKVIFQNPSKSLELSFNLPVRAIDTSKIRFRNDSLAVGRTTFSIQKDSVSPRKWFLQTAWRTKGGTFSLEILPGALTDFWGETNADTLRRTIQLISTKELGDLAVKTTGLNIGSYYILELLQGETVLEKRAFLAKMPENQFVFTSVQAGQFSGRLIEDANANGIWDSGSYAEKKQPERIAVQKFEALKAGFESETEIAAPGSSAKVDQQRKRG